MRKLLSTLSSTLQGGVRGGLLLLALVATTNLWAEDFSVDGIYYNYLGGNNVKVTYRGNFYDKYDDEYSGEVIIPSTVTYNGTTYSVTSIGYAAFYNCSCLPSVTIPNSVTSIGNSAFEGCSRLTSITIPNSVTSIGNSAFEGCPLTSVTIGNSVTSIGDRAFAGCPFTSITIPNSVTSIGNSAFEGCSRLTSITIGNSVTSIGESTFRHCSSLTSINIPNSVTSIGQQAFSSCRSLTSITIPNSVTSIGMYAFYDCSSLATITCLGTTPPDAGNLGAKTYACKLIVPRSAYNAYVRHAYWGQFTMIDWISSEEAETEEVVVESGTTTIQKIMRDGQLIILRDEVEYNAMGQEL